MPVIATTVDPRSQTYRDNRAGMEALLAAHTEQVALACAGGGARYAERHRTRGRLLARERIELLLDPDTAFLELSPAAAWGSPFAVGASIVTGIGVVSGFGGTRGALRSSQAMSGWGAWASHPI